MCEKHHAGRIRPYTRLCPREKTVWTAYRNFPIDAGQTGRSVISYFAVASIAGSTFADMYTKLSASRAYVYAVARACDLGNVSRQVTCPPL